MTFNRFNLTVLSLVAGGLFAASLYHNTKFHPTTDAERAHTSVTITNFEHTSGGSGVIYSSGSEGSYILTNAHVCGLAKTGAIVTSDSMSSPVTSFQVSELHDICRIKVQANFGVNTEVASSPAAIFDEAIATGHPSLLPTINTHGHFGDFLMVQVLVGFRPCTAADLEGENGMFCMFLGGVPVVKTYKSQVISATILPGASGSPVFNSSGYVENLVFAGAQGLTYGLTVPNSYLFNFVRYEVNNLTIQYPNADAGTETKSDHNSRRRLRDYCNNAQGTSFDVPSITELCSSIYEII